MEQSGKQREKENKKMYTVRCSCGNYTPDDFGSVELAETTSKIHVMLGEEHVITCTRPAHFYKGGLPVVVFTCHHGATAPIIPIEKPEVGEGYKKGAVHIPPK